MSPVFIETAPVVSCIYAQPTPAQDTDQAAGNQDLGIQESSLKSLGTKSFILTRSNSSSLI